MRISDLSSHEAGMINEVKKEYQSSAGGLNAKGRAYYNRQGHNLKTPVSKNRAKRSPKAAGRRKSFCSRMGGQKEMHNIDCRQDPDKAICKALNRWDCSEAFERQLVSILENMDLNPTPSGLPQTEANNIIGRAFDKAGIRGKFEGFYDLYGKWMDMTLATSTDNIRVQGVVEPHDWKPLEGHEITNNWVTPIDYKIESMQFNPEDILAIHEIKPGEFDYEDIRVVDNR